MYIHVELKRGEIAANDKLIECIRDMIPEEADIKIMSFEDVNKKLLENGAYHRENNFAAFDIEDQGDDVIISLGIDEDFTVDTIKFLNKVVDAGSGLVGAFTGFLATVKILGTKFGKKVGSYFKEFSEKWNLIPEPKSGMYDVIQYTFHCQVGDKIRENCGASVITRRDEKFEVVDRYSTTIGIHKSDIEEYDAAMQMAEYTAITNLESNFQPMYSLEEARIRATDIVLDFEDSITDSEEDTNK